MQRGGFVVGEGGWVPACARTRGGRLCAGKVGRATTRVAPTGRGRGRGMGPRLREDTEGGMGFTPILTFPPEGGRDGEGVPGGEIPRGTRNDIWGALGERAVREPPLRGDGRRGRGRGTGRGIGWVPACARTRGGGGSTRRRDFLEGLGMTFGVRWGNGRFANRPYGGMGGGGGGGERGGG